ncbi:hypothetical protein XM38_045050 [Halomicronema hongdechloris C2206]|uniref:Uncharacterized protein n=1 Tax=Halomicronema hongdechloris C2206 TaxID=1641165 RepID=A0A1Z3HT97_9CYAN|nr:hypothetical protein [Halomicronema hongdechloris]ASC73538.1 hypothetical protein XM38_045050 [Halomicronema hongdechloris C2206]
MADIQTCPICGVKIMVGIVGGDRVLFSAGPPGTRSKLYARVCRYVDKPSCINRQAASQTPQPDDFYRHDQPPSQETPSQETEL